MKIIEISERAIAVVGDSYIYRKKLKELGGSWNRKHMGWVYPKTKRDLVQGFLNEPDLSKNIDMDDLRNTYKKFDLGKLFRSKKKPNRGVLKREIKAGKMEYAIKRWFNGMIDSYEYNTVTNDSFKPAEDNERLIDDLKRAISQSHWIYSTSIDKSDKLGYYILFSDYYIRYKQSKPEQKTETQPKPEKKEIIIDLQEWFGESKVIDENKAPLVVYHGTDKIFTKFDQKGTVSVSAMGLDATKESDWYSATSLLGFWFNSEKNPGGREYEYKIKAYLRIITPFYVDSLDELVQTMKDDIIKMENIEKDKYEIFEDVELNHNLINRLLEEYKGDGWDGIIVKNDEEFGGRSYVAFNASQIKIISTDQGRKPEPEIKTENMEPLFKGITANEFIVLDVTQALKSFARDEAFKKHGIADQVDQLRNSLVAKGLLLKNTAITEKGKKLVSEIYQKGQPYFFGYDKLIAEHWGGEKTEAKPEPEAVTEPTEKQTFPWDGAKVEDEMKWYGTKLSLHSIYDKWAGANGERILIRVLNGGGLLEVRKAGETIDDTIRISPDHYQIKIVELVEKPEDPIKYNLQTLKDQVYELAKVAGRNGGERLADYNTEVRVILESVKSEDIWELKSAYTSGYEAGKEDKEKEIKARKEAKTETANTQFGKGDDWLKIYPNQKYAKPVKKIDINPDPDDKSVEILFKDMISRDILRPVMNGVFFSEKGIVGTNAHLLAFTHADIPDKFEGNIYCVTKWCKDYSDKEGKIGGKFPNFQQVTPNSADFAYVIDALTLKTYAEIIQRSDYINSLTDTMVLAYGDNQVIGAKTSFIISAMEFMMRLGHESVVVRLQEPNRAIVFTPHSVQALKAKFDPTNDDYCLVMPMMLGYEHISQVYQGDLDRDMFINVCFDVRIGQVISSVLYKHTINTDIDKKTAEKSFIVEYLDSPYALSCGYIGRKETQYLVSKDMAIVNGQMDTERYGWVLNELKKADQNKLIANNLSIVDGENLIKPFMSSDDIEEILRNYFGYEIRSGDFEDEAEPWLFRDGLLVNEKQVPDSPSKLARQWFEYVTDTVKEPEPEPDEPEVETEPENKQPDLLGHVAKDGETIYGDSNFVNSVSGNLPNSEIKHMGHGEFYLKTPEGDIQFARGGKDFEGMAGRSHTVYDDQGGKLVEKLLTAMGFDLENPDHFVSIDVVEPEPIPEPKPEPEPETEKKLTSKNQIPASVRKFMPWCQQDALVEMQTEEHWDIFKNLESIISQIPNSRKVGAKWDKEKKPGMKFYDYITAYLHYFYAGSDWYVLGVNKLDGKDMVFIYAILNGDTQNSETGDEWLNTFTETKIGNYSCIELDFFFKPKPLSQALYGKYPNEFPAPYGFDKPEEKKPDPIPEPSAYSGPPIATIERMDLTKPDPLPEPIPEPEPQPEPISISIKDYPDAYMVNQAIEKLIDQKGDDPKNYSSDEKVFINHYSGYGGLDKYTEKYKGEYRESVWTEFYTPLKVVEKMWALAYIYGFTDEGLVYEPSAGAGAFLKFAPDLKRVTAIEMMPYSAKILKILYPEANIIHAKFESLFIRNNYTIGSKVSELEKADLVIGNPPYHRFESEQKGMGEGQYTKAGNYVEYFIFRGLDLLKPGGLLIYIVGAEPRTGGQTFLYSGPSKCKEKIANKCELVDAWELPNGTFSRSQCSAQILILKKL